VAISKTSEKVFDIGKPGGSDTPIGSKPMVIGHSFIQNDPTLSAPELPTKGLADKPANQEATESIKSPAKKIILQPISHAEEIDESPKKDPVEDVKVAAEPSQNEAPESTPQTNTNESSEVTKEQSENPELKPVQTAEEREDQVEQLIKSKKYFVEIKEQSAGIKNINSKSAYIVALILLILGIIVAIDSGLIDIGVELPFSLL
jgi:uncharacterized membrane protein